MPLYPYRCTQCGYRFEKIQRFSAKPEKICPQCGGALERLLTAPGLKFKGSGWYVNDYAAKSGTPAPDAAPAGAKSEAKSETKSKTESPAGGSAAAASPAASAPATTPGAKTN